MILKEENFQSEIITESDSGNGEKKAILRGVFSEIANRNRNGRIYSKEDMEKMVRHVNEAAAIGQHVLGECDHPNTLDVKLENVSHKINKMWIEGNTIYGEAEILYKSPKGAIIKSLIDSGIKLGVSSRGAGSLNESTGEVRNYRYITHDIVARPSVASAIPESIMESLGMYRRGDSIIELAEAVHDDPIAQKYLAIEMQKFIDSLKSK